MMTRHLHGMEKSGVNILLNLSFSISSKSYLEQHEGEVNENRKYCKLLISLQLKKRSGREILIFTEFIYLSMYKEAAEPSI